MVVVRVLRQSTIRLHDRCSVSARNCLQTPVSAANDVSLPAPGRDLALLLQSIQVGSIRLRPNLVSPVLAIDIADIVRGIADRSAIGAGRATLLGRPDIVIMSFTRFRSCLSPCVVIRIYLAKNLLLVVQCIVQRRRRVILNAPPAATRGMGQVAPGDQFAVLPHL